MNSNNNDNNSKNKFKNNFLNHREYIIKIKNNEYNLRIEIDKKYIYFILSQLNEILEYVYKNKIDLIDLLNNLD